MTSIKTNIVYNALKTCASILFPIITIPYINRILHPANVGKVDFARSFISYFSLISTLGITVYAIRECASVRDNKYKLSYTASQLFSINLITTFLSYLLLVSTLILTNKFSYYKHLILIYSTTLIFTTLGTDWLNSAMEDFRYITLRTFSLQIISLVLMLLFVRHEDDYIRYMLIIVFSSSGANIANIRYRKKYCQIRFTLNIKWKKHISPIIFLFVMTLSQIIFHNVDVTMLGMLKGDYEVGIYSTAHKITGMVSTIVSSAGLVVIPRLSYYFSLNDYDNANKLLQKLLGLNISLGFPLFIGIIMLADDISLLVGGSEFMATAPIMRILIISFLFSLLGGNFLGNAILIATKKEKYYMIICCITAMFNILLNALLIPTLGAVGASIATAFNGLIILLLLLLKLDKKIKIKNIRSILIKPIIGCVGFIVSCYLCSNISNVYIRTSCNVVLGFTLYLITQIELKNPFVLEFLQPIGGKLVIMKNIIKNGKLLA